MSELITQCHSMRVIIIAFAVLADVQERVKVFIGRVAESL